MRCLTAIAVAFVVSPFVALAGCGGGQKKAANVKPLNGFTILGVVPGVQPGTTQATIVLNAALPGNTAGLIKPKTNVTLKDLVPGAWVTVADNNNVTFQGTIFKVSKVNGGVPVAEIWVADPTKNTK